MQDTNAKTKRAAKVKRIHYQKKLYQKQTGKSSMYKQIKKMRCNEEGIGSKGTLAMGIST
jgi:hypothetical protein